MDDIIYISLYHFWGSGFWDLHVTFLIQIDKVISCVVFVKQTQRHVSWPFYTLKQIGEFGTAQNMGPMHSEIRKENGHCASRYLKFQHGHGWKEKSSLGS